MEFRILGVLEASDGPRTIELRGSKLRTLLAVLVLHANEVVSADALIEAIWGDSAPDTAANTLQGYVSQLRKALGANTIQTRAPGYALSIPAESVDAVRFEALLKDGQAALARDEPAVAARMLDEALGLWRGQALADFTFDSFAQVDIARLEELRVVATEHLAEAELDLGRHDELGGRLRSLVESHPLRERLWGQLVLALYRSGRQAEALRALAEVRRRLGEELGIEPGIGLRRLEEDVLLQRAHLDWRPPAAAAAAEVPSNLPARRSSFVGRETEIEELDKLLGSRRLVTVVGPGGVGKTRLALEVAGRMRSRFPDGVWVVELASLTNPSLVPGAVAQTLDVREQLGASPLDPLARALASRRLLLVLDNCEHLVGAAAGLADTVLDVAPSLTILATSREPLRVSGEHVYALSPLPLPPRDDLATEALSTIDAVRLFCDRAEAQGSFSLTTENASAVAALCRQLDGIPLAIELAAARLRALTPSQIVARLDDRFDLLSSGERTALPRHQTLRAAVDWSHDLLSPAEGILFRRLSVFVGSFSLDAAAAVCADDVVDLSRTVELVASLVDHSLVIPLELHGERRFRLLETLRAYAADRLVEAGEQREVHQRLLAWAVEFAESFSEALDPRRMTDKLALERLDAENDNIRQALTWAVAADPQGALRMLAAVGRYWNIRGYVGERRRWGDLALSAGPDTPATTRAQVLRWAGMLAIAEGNMGEARPLLEEAVNSFRQLGDAQSEAYTLAALSWIANDHFGDYDAAEGLLRKAIAIYADDDDDHLYCERLGQLAVNTMFRGEMDKGLRLAEEAWSYNIRHADDPCPEVLESSAQAAFLQGELKRAQVLFEQALAHNRDVGRAANLPDLLGWLGDVALSTGDLAEAERRFGEHLRTAQELGKRRETEYALGGLARVALRRGDTLYARSALSQAMRIAGESGRAIVADDLETVAELLVTEGRYQDAAKLLGAAEVWREAVRVPIPLPYRPKHNQLVCRVADGLNRESFATAWDEGRRMRNSEARAIALRMTPLPPALDASGVLATDGDPRRLASKSGS